MNDKQTLKLALEALEYTGGYRGPVYEKAITAIKQALAAPVQEPVAWEQYAIKFAKGRKLTYGKPENLPSYIGVRALVYADTTPPAQPAPVKPIKPSLWEQSRGITKGQP